MNTTPDGKVISAAVYHRQTNKRDGLQPFTNHMRQTTHFVSGTNSLFAYYFFVFSTLPLSNSLNPLHPKGDFVKFALCSMKAT